jgi:TM2 domain-containing membrane protein YozV
MKDKNVAGVLALFLGWVGIHRFYLGQIGLGILYAVFCWFPLIWLVALIDAIVLFSTDSEVFNMKYNREWMQERGIYRPDFRRQPRADFERTAQRTQPQQQPMPQPLQRHAAERPNPHKTTGLEKFKDFDYAGAIADFKKSLEIAPQDIATHFNLACAYSLTEDADLAFSHLDKAVALGFQDFAKIKQHHALAFLRIQKDFDQFASNGYRTPPQAALPVEQDLLSSRPNLLEHLQKLADLRDRGLLTEQEYEAEKQKLG